MNGKRIAIIEADQTWADRYRLFCQRAYQSAYPRPEIGITADLFSDTVFGSQRIKTYFNELLTPQMDNKFWLAISGHDRIVGGVGCRRHVDYCEMIAFYVDSKLTGQGIGHQLYRKVHEFAGTLPIQVEVIEYMTDTIRMYEHWGFEVDDTKAKIAYPWTEWPNAAIDSYQALTMVKPVRQQF